MKLKQLWNYEKIYIVIEDFGPEFPYIVIDIEGMPIIFKSEEEAKEEASLCQNGKVVEL